VNSIHYTLHNIARNLPTDDDDDTNDKPVLLPSDSRIEDLFDFTNDTWVKIMKEVSLRGLDEELKLYELIELDVQGDDDVLGGKLTPLDIVSKPCHTATIISSL